MRFAYTRIDVVATLACAGMTAACLYRAVESHASPIVVWLLGGVTILLIAAPHLSLLRETKSRSGFPNERVVFDDKWIRRTTRSGETESIQWDELAEVKICSADTGPWSGDLYWILCNLDRSEGWAVANDADGFKDLLSRLQTLPGFDNQKVVEAMGSTSNQHFSVWKRNFPSRSSI